MKKKKNVDPDEITTIRVRWSTKERLKDLGRIGDSEENMILLLLKIAEPIILKARERDRKRKFKEAKEREKEELSELYEKTVAREKIY